MFKLPLGWVLLSVEQFLLAIFFLFILNQFTDPGAAELYADYGVMQIVVVSFLKISGIILLLMTPFITMRTFSEERQTGSIKLLQSSPVSAAEFVLGKYLGTVCYFFSLLVLVMLMPLSLLIGAKLDMLQLLSAFIGLLLLISTFGATGLFISSLTRHPALAATGTFAVLFVLWVMNIAGNTGTELYKNILAYLSLLDHYHGFIDGVFNSADVIYYLLVSTVFIVLSIWRFDSERLY